MFAGFHNQSSLQTMIGKYPLNTCKAAQDVHYGEQSAAVFFPYFKKIIIIFVYLFLVSHKTGLYMLYHDE